MYNEETLKLTVKLLKYWYWKDKSIISTETVSMVTNLSKKFLKLNQFSSFEIKNKLFSSQEDHDRGKRSCFYSKVLVKLSPKTRKPYQITYIFCNRPVISFHSASWYQIFGTKRNLWVAMNLQSPTNYSNDTSTLLLTLQLC